MVSSALPEAIFPAKCGIGGYMAALAVSRVSFISWCSWSKRSPSHVKITLTHAGFFVVGTRRSASARPDARNVALGGPDDLKPPEGGTTGLPVFDDQNSSGSEIASTLGPHRTLFRQTFSQENRVCGSYAAARQMKDRPARNWCRSVLHGYAHVQRVPRYSTVYSPSTTPSSRPPD